MEEVDDEEAPVTANNPLLPVPVLSFFAKAEREDDGWGGREDAYAEVEPEVKEVDFNADTVSVFRACDL